ncbi:hypothetical protein K492DRAFT_177936 [Lichtheimia hyalospora FSU 10163]|nr:hypothetical protein K492DRAFT_177936 [Lichtheimia hyalospora FSU 10163]
MKLLSISSLFLGATLFATAVIAADTENDDTQAGAVTTQCETNDDCDSSEGLICSPGKFCCVDSGNKLVQAPCCNGYTQKKGEIYCA